MAVNIKCKFCNNSFSAKEEVMGQDIVCPKCSGVFTAIKDIDFMEAAERSCGFCGKLMPRSIEVCTHCGNPIDIDTFAISQQIPQVKKTPISSPSERKNVLFAFMACIFLLSVSVSYFIFLRKQSIVKFFPKDTKVACLFHLKKSKAFFDKAFFDYFEKKLYKTFDFSTQANLRTDIKIVGVIFVERLGKLDWILFLDGNFPQKAYTKKRTRGNYFEGKYIFRDKKKRYIYSRLSSQIIIGAKSNNEDLVKEIIILYKKGGKTSVFEEKLLPFYKKKSCFALAHSINFHKETCKNILVRELFKNTTNTKICLEQKKKSFVLDLQFLFEQKDDVENFKKDFAYMEQRLKRVEKEVVHGADIVHILSKVKRNEHKKNLTLQIVVKRDEFITFSDALQTIFFTNELQNIELVEKWKQYNAMNFKDKMTLLDRIILNKTHRLYKKAVTEKKRLEENKIEVESSEYYNNLMAKVSKDDPITQWNVLRKFPGKYKKTSTYNKVKMELFKVENEIFEAIKNHTKMFEEMRKTSRYEKWFQYKGKMKYYFQRKEGLKQLARKLKKRDEVKHFFLVFHKTDKAYNAKIQQDKNNKVLEKQKFEQDVNNYIEKDFNTLVVKRKFKEIFKTLAGYKNKIKDKGLIEKINEKQQEVKKMRKLFYLLYQQFKYFKKRKKMISISLKNGKALRGTIEKISKTKFLLKTYKKLHLVKFYEIKAATLAKFLTKLPKKLQTGETMYYLGKFMVYENEIRWAKRCLRDSSKMNYEKAEMLLKKLDSDKE